MLQHTDVFIQMGPQTFTNKYERCGRVYPYSIVPQNNHRDRGVRSMQNEQRTLS